MKSHLQGKRHCRLFDEQRKRREDVECSIFVRGFPPGTTDTQLQMIFSRFGPVTNVFLETERGQFAFVRFQSPETVSILLSPHFGPLYIGNSRLSVRPRQYRPVTPSTKCHASPATSSGETSKTNRGDLLQQLGSCANVEQQMVALQMNIELSHQEVQEREYIRQQLQELFQTRTPDCQVFLFGSSVSGVGMHGCDMDIFLDVTSDDLVLQNGHSDDKCCPVLNPVSKMLRRCNGFNNILVIKSARCPLVKFEHVQSGLKCDLSMNNRLALQNTRLIKLVCDVDPRIQALMYNVRYWAKLKQLAGNPSGGLRVTNYALTMMVILYMQQLDMPILPSIEQLAKFAADAGQTCNIDGWDCSFGSDLGKLRSMAAANTDRLPHLLAGFFSFYATFDLSSYVLCTRTAAAVDVAAFSSCMKEDERLVQFKISPICVQDPFVLNHNVTSSANERLRARFTAEAQAASNLFAQPDFSVPDPSRPWGIAGLLAVGPLVDDVVSAAPTGRQNSMHSFTIVMESSKLPVSYVQKFSNVAELKDGWSHDMCKLIRKLLEDVLFFQCVEIKEETSQSSASRTVSSEKKHLVEMHGSLKCSDNASRTKRLSGNESGLTTTCCGEKQTGHQLAEASSSVNKTKANVSELPSRSSSGEIRKTSEDMDELCVTSDGNTASESDLEGEVSDGVEMDVEECQVGKRPSSDDLVDTNILKRCRPEDKSSCRSGTLTDQATLRDVAVASRTAPAQSSIVADGTTIAGQSCTGTMQGAGNVSSQAVTTDARSGTQRHATSGVEKTNTTGGHSAPTETATSAVLVPAVAPLPVGGTRRGAAGTTWEGLQYCLHCSSRSGVWSGRKKFHKTLKRSSLTGLEAEIQISKLVAEKQGEHTAVMDFSFRLTFMCVSSHGQTVLVVDTQPTSGAKMFSCFFLFFKSFVNKHAQLAFT